MNSAKEEPWIADVGYRVSEAGHKWAESKCGYASALYLDANFEEAFKIDDVSSVFHYQPIAKLDKLSSNIAGEHDQCKVFNGLLGEDEVANLTLSACFPKLSEDNMFDLFFTNKVPELDFKFCDDELGFGISRSAINCPDTSNEVVGMPELSAPYPKISRSTACEMHDVIESKCRGETLIEDGMHLNCFDDRMSIKCSMVVGTQNVHLAKGELYKESNKVNQDNQLMEAEFSSINRLLTSGPLGEKVARPRQRRLCRPPKKYAEELAMSKPREGRRKKHAMNSSKDNDLGGTSQKKYHGKTSKRKELEVSRISLELDTDDGSKPCKSRCRRKKYCKPWSSDEELDTDDNYKPCKSRRKTKKCINPWTLDEVVKLVDGIAHFGQGQWTAVQRTFFTVSSRTPTDIRDKWRNLVKANCGISKKKIKETKNHSSLPDTIIERVKELA